MQQHKNDLPNMEDFFNLSTYIPKFKRCIEIKTDLKRICTIYPKGSYFFYVDKILDFFDPPSPLL